MVPTGLKTKFWVIVPDLTKLIARIYPQSGLRPNEV